MVEAAGIEPDHPQLTNWLMAHDFCRKTLIPSRFSSPIESPGVPCCPLESTPVVEIFWRRCPLVLQTLLTRLGVHTPQNWGGRSGGWLRPGQIVHLHEDR
jgi:hypothetical protein